MQTTATRLGPSFVIVLIAACAPRSDARPNPPPRASVPLESEDMAWLEQHAVDLQTAAIEVPEAQEAPLYPSLAALAREEQWACGDRAIEACVRDFGSVTLSAPGELRSVQLLGVPTERMVAEGEEPRGACEWRLVTRSERGWLASISLGTSPSGCVRTLDPKLEELDWVYWFPLALSATADAVRIEGQGQTLGDHWMPEPENAGPRRIDHLVHLCRVHRRALACSHEAKAGRTLQGAFSDPLPASFTTPLPLAPEVLPTSRVGAVGTELAADWVGLPTIGDQPIHPVVAYRFTRSRMLEWRLGDGVLMALMSEEGESLQLLFQQAGVTRRLRHLETDASNEDQRLVAVEASRDVVHLTLELTNHGPATITWRTEVLAVAPDLLGLDASTQGPHMFILPSGISLAEGANPASGWRLDVKVVAGGVHLSEADGPLAWFRETGRFTWSQLVTVVPRWRARLARALRVAAALEEPRSRTAALEGKETTARVQLLPGYVEPLELPRAPASFAVPLTVVP